FAVETDHAPRARSIVIIVTFTLRIASSPLRGSLAEECRISVPMETGLAGKVVVITGASGGIGSAIATQFAAEGAKLVLHYRTKRSGLEALQKKLKSVESLIIRANLNKETDVRRLFAHTIKRF